MSYSVHCKWKWWLGNISRTTSGHDSTTTTHWQYLLALEHLRILRISEDDTPEKIQFLIGTNEFSVRLPLDTTWFWKESLRRTMHSNTSDQDIRKLWYHAESTGNIQIISSALARCWVIARYPKLLPVNNTRSKKMFFPDFKLKTWTMREIETVFPSDTGGEREKKKKQHSRQNAVSFLTMYNKNS